MDLFDLKHSKVEFYQGIGASTVEIKQIYGHLVRIHHLWVLLTKVEDVPMPVKGFWFVWVDPDCNCE